MNTIVRTSIALSIITCIVGCSTTQPTPAVAIRKLADRQFQRGEFDQAVVGYTEITDRFPGDWEAQYHLGLCQLKLDNPFIARQALEVAHTRRPQHVGIVDALAEAMFLQDDQNRLYSFLRERADSTQSVYAYLRLAKYSIELGDPDSARKALENAIVLDDGQSVTPYLQAADFAERIGDLDLAVNRLRQAYYIDPYNDMVKTRLRELGEIPGPTLAMPPG